MTPVLLLITVMIFAYSIQIVYAEPVSSQYLTVNRRLEITNGGLVIIKDTYYIQNNGSTPIQEFIVYLEKSVSDNLDKLTASSNIVTRIQSASDAIDEIFVTFPQAINPGDSYVFNLTYVFFGLVDEYTSGTYRVIIPPYPMLPSTAVFCNLTIVMPETTTMTNLEDMNFTQSLVNSRRAFNYVKQPLEFLSNETLAIMFKANIMQMFYVYSLSRSFVLDSFGNIYVSDSYSVRYLGSSPTSTISLDLMENRTSVSASDDIGGLKVVSVFGNATVSYATVSFRFYLRRNDNASFTVNYVIPTKEYIKAEGIADSYVFRFGLYPNLNWTVKNLEVKVLLPEGGKYISSSSQPARVEKRGLQTTLKYASSSVTPLDVSDVSLDYSYTIFWAAFRPTLWSGLFFGFIGAAILLFRQRKPVVKATEEEVPFDLIREFLDLYEERKALTSELEEDEEAERRKVLRKEDRKRMKIIRIQLDTLNKRIGDVKTQIRARAPRYGEALRKIEIAESDLEATKDNIRTIETQLRSSRISREAHDKLYRSYQKRINGAKSTIDGVIIGLREEVDRQQ